jgi:acyl-CoA synthetase (AMP-forming)/AMP-acid ligase II
MANVRQLSTFEQPERRSRQDCRDIVLGLMPQSHIYALIIMCHAAPYRGDKVIVLPKYNLRWVLQSIQTYAIHTLFLVPAVIVDLVRSRELLATFDTTSVNKIVTGAAPMGPETAKQLTKQFPNWHLCQGYGMTETATVVSWTSQSDISLGSSGSFLPGTRCKLITEEGKEVSDYNHTGEVLISSPSLALGYHNNDSATEKSFFKDEDCRWFRTGDEAVIRRSNEGHEHIWITGRVKDLIKVKVSCITKSFYAARLC